MSPAAAHLIYLTMGRMADYLFGADSPARARLTLQSLFRSRSDLFSYEFAEVIGLPQELMGLVLAYPASAMASLQLPSAIHLIRAAGLVGFLRFMFRAGPLLTVKEAEADEFFIAHLAVLPAYQGRGLGTVMLAHAARRAQEAGCAALSITVDVDNPRARTLYLRSGFELVETVRVDALENRIGYHGFHRMRKRLHESLLRPAA